MLVHQPIETNKADVAKAVIENNKFSKIFKLTNAGGPNNDYEDASTEERGIMKASTEAWNSKNTLKCKLSVCYTLCSSIKLENILSPGVLIEEPIHGERSWSGKELEQKQTGITCLQFEQSNRYIGSCQVEILIRCYHHVLKFPIVQIWQGGK